MGSEKENKGAGAGRVLSIDLETYSDVDLGNCGVYRYVEGDFHILLFAYAFDDEDVQIVDMAQGEQIPQEVIDAIHDDSIIKAAWNAAFERTCLSQYFGERLSPDAWQCSMVWAASLSLPLALKNAAMVLKTGEQKDKAGEALIRYFSVPCRPTKTNGGRTRNLPEHAPEDWQRFKEYCVQDVRTERDIRHRLESFPLPDSEWDYYHMDQRINDRGVRIDRDLVAQAITCDLMMTEEMTRRAYELTGLENPNSVSQLKGWLTERGIEVDSLGKKNVAALIDDLDKNSVDGEAQEMMKLRLQMAKSSVKKYQAADRCICDDGRAHGLFQFSGANRTQRWCLTGDHEVLTDRGWKRLDGWTGGKIACWNAQTEAVSFQEANALSFPYVGPMYTYQDARIDQTSTPDHKMRVQARRGKPWADMTVENMSHCRPLIPMFGYRHTVGSPNPDWLRVMVMTQADGTFSVDKQLTFHFRKVRKVERCKMLLRKAGVCFNVREYSDSTIIQIPARVLPLWLREFRDKTFGSWLLDEDAEVFFDELPYWDGSRTADNSIQYVTVNKRNADLVQALAHMSGRTAVMILKEHEKVNSKWSNAYVLNIWNNAANQHEIRVKPSIAEFDGMVFCAETPTGYFLVRRNGKVWVTGNSGRLIQLQNLPQNHIRTLDEARELLKMGAFDMLEVVYGNTPDILSQLLRTMLIPRDGCIFIVCDFSAIEARVLAWLAGEQWRLDAFRRGEDIYCASASQVFGVPVVKHGINGELRQKGKVAELACIAESELVLTDRGLVPIQDVTSNMKVWDGEEWVSHGGVIYRGEREVITYEGLTATPDHLVFIEGKTEPIQFRFAAASGAHLVQTGDGRQAIRMGGDNRPGKTLGEELEQAVCADTVPGVRFDSVAAPGKSEKREIERLPGMLSKEADTTLAGSQTDSSEAKMRESKRSGVPQLRCEGNTVQVSSCDRCGHVSHKDIRPSGQDVGNRQDQQQRSLCSRESEICGAVCKSGEQADNCSEPVRSEILAICRDGSAKKTVQGNEQRTDYSGCCGCRVREAEELEGNSRQVRVYDIRNAGRHHRFTVSNCLVHNCGYGGASGALISMGALDMGLKESELPDIIESWRTANPKIVQFWWDVENAATETVKDHKDRTVGRVGFQFSANTLWIVLPSGRRLAYIKPKLMPNRFGRMAITFEGLNTGNKWSRGETYSGKLVENITQATARDLLAEAMWRVEREGLDIVAHVHDEMILEVPEGTATVEQVSAIMNRNPVWADGLCLSSSGYWGRYYFKD